MRQLNQADPPGLRTGAGLAKGINACCLKSTGEAAVFVTVGVLPDVAVGILGLLTTA